MKFEKEATTKSGQRTWKVTYELVRGPEPKLKPKRRAEKAAATPEPPSYPKRETRKPPPGQSQPNKPAAKPIKRKNRQNGKTQAQLGLF